MVFELLLKACIKVYMRQHFFISLRFFKMMKIGVYFIVIALVVAELFKTLIYVNVSLSYLNFFPLLYRILTLS